MLSTTSTAPLLAARRRRRVPNTCYALGAQLSTPEPPPAAGRAHLPSRRPEQRNKGEPSGASEAPGAHRPLSAAAGSPALLLPAAQRPAGRVVSPNFTPAAAFERAARAAAAEPAAPRGGAGSGGSAALQEAGSERGGKAASPSLCSASRCPRPAGWRPRWSCPSGPRGHLGSAAVRGRWWPVPWDGTGARVGEGNRPGCVQAADSREPESQHR